MVTAADRPEQPKRISLRAKSRASRLPLTAAVFGSFFWWGALFLGYGLVLLALDLPSARVPAPWNTVFFVAAYGPVIAALFISFGAPFLLPFLFEKEQARAVVDREGLTIHSGDGTERRFAHEQIAGLREQMSWRAMKLEYELTDPAGRSLAPVPAPLVNLSRDEELGGELYLAEAMLLVRPDRYVGIAQMPPRFRLRGAGEPESDVLALRRPGELIFLGVGVVLAIGAFLLVVMTALR